MILMSGEGRQQMARKGLLQISGQSCGEHHFHLALTGVQLLQNYARLQDFNTDLFVALHIPEYSLNCREGNREGEAANSSKYL